MEFQVRTREYDIQLSQLPYFKQMCLQGTLGGQANLEPVALQYVETLSKNL